MILIFVIALFLGWIAVLPVIIACADRPETRRADPIPAAWIVREPVIYTQSLERIPSLAHYTARVVCRRGHAIPSGTWCHECEGR